MNTIRARVAAPSACIGYVAHDLGDPAIARRVAMLTRGGATVTLLGFHRLPKPPTTVAGVAATPIGQTHDARFIDRITAIGRALLRLPRWRKRLHGGDVVIARNLEALVIAIASAAFSRPKPRLVYELLDVHRLLSDDGTKGRVIRRIEGALLRRCDLVITSSPAFITGHLRRRYADLPPVLLVENKVSGPLPAAADAATRSAAPPWRIGWFGNLRCRESLLFLADLARRSPDRIEIDLRGSIDLPIRDILDDVLAACPNIRYHGRYQNPDDLARIYSRVHFVWAIDMFEEGENSNWLLPNRLYEGCGFGAVPIALSGVETGAWLHRNGLGIRLVELADLVGVLDAMSSQSYTTLRTVVEAAPRSLFFTDPSDCLALVDTILGRKASAEHAYLALRTSA